MNNPRKGGLCALGLVVAVGFAGAASAGKLADTMAKPGGFPERPMTMIVPYGSCGGSCQVAQAIAKGVKDHAGVEIKLEFKPGGSGMVGLKNFLAAPADGYTVLEHIDDATSAYVSGASKVNPAKDLIPLVISQITFSQIYIRGDETRFTDWASFVKFAKARPKEKPATIANVSREGSMERVNLKQILDHFGVNLQQVSYDKAGERYGALKGKHVDVMFEQPGDVRGFLESGDFKPILTLLHQRPSAFADVPSMKDVGLTFKPLMRFRGFYTHKDTPPDRVKWLQWAFQKAFYTKSYQAFNKRKFMDLIDSFRDTAGAKKLIDETAASYRKTYKAMGLIK